MSLKNLSVTIKIPKLLRNKLNNKRINLVYKRFEQSLNINDNFVVAVSGGPDSLALAFLAKIYSIKKKIKVKFFIVDHKLRSESTKEAQLVRRNLKKYTINAEILTWRGLKPSKNIQSIARKKRYELLFKKCDQLSIKNIFLGHHQDDLFENFFIRLLRGSGLKGLISFEKKSKLEDKFLFRPLLYEKKENLEFLSRKVFNFYVKDPTNNDEKYQRIRIRNLIKELNNNGLDKKKFFKTLKNLNYSNNVINFHVSENLRKNTFFSSEDNKLIINRDFFIQPHEIIFRSFSDGIRIIGKKYYSVRGKKLDNIIKNIKNNSLFRVTLGGCIIEKVNQTVIVSKEH